MNKSNVIELEGREASTDLLRTGARQLIQHAVEAELQELLAAHADQQLADGRAGSRPALRFDAYREMRYCYVSKNYYTVAKL